VGEWRQLAPRPVPVINRARLRWLRRGVGSGAGQPLGDELRVRIDELLGGLASRGVGREVDLHQGHLTEEPLREVEYASIGIFRSCAWRRLAINAVSPPPRWSPRTQRPDEQHAPHPLRPALASIHPALTLGPRGQPCGYHGLGNDGGRRSSPVWYSAGLSGCNRSAQPRAPLLLHHPRSTARQVHGPHQLRRRRSTDCRAAPVTLSAAAG
jgi:hypothetical protein